MGCQDHEKKEGNCFRFFKTTYEQEMQCGILKQKVSVLLQDTGGTLGKI